MGPDVFSPFSISRFKASAIVSSVTPSSDTFLFADDSLFKHDLKAKVEQQGLVSFSSLHPFHSLVGQISLAVTSLTCSHTI
jgi:hypothetical protein